MDVDYENVSSSIDNGTVITNKEQVEFDLVRNVFSPCRDIALFVLIFTGNLLVLLSVTKYRKLRTSTNYMLASLSCADLLVSVSSLMSFFKWLYCFKWLELSSVYDSTTMFLSVLSITSSILSLIAIAVDRYICTRWPLKYRTRRNTSQTVVVICIVWLLSIAAAMPTIILARNRNGCSSEAFHVKTHTITLGFIIVSAGIVIVFVNGLIGLTKRRSRHRVMGMLAAVDTTFQRQESKSTKLILIISLVFILCWMPIGFSCIMLKYTTVNYEKRFYSIRAVFMSLAGSNSFMNPIIYCYNNQSFRTAFKSLLCGVCQRLNSVTPDTDLP